MKGISYTAAAREIRALGFKVTRTEGEIRVAWPGNESAAYYTDCPEDALATARHMATETAPAPDAEGVAVDLGFHEPGAAGFDVSELDDAAELLEYCPACLQPVQEAGARHGGRIGGLSERGPLMIGERFSTAGLAHSAADLKTAETGRPWQMAFRPRASRSGRPDTTPFTIEPAAESATARKES